MTPADGVAGLAERARGGDRQAFAALHAALAPAVAAVLLARVPHQEVDDLMQEVFLAAWRALPDLRQSEHVGAWLLTIARHAASRRHARARPRPDELPDELPDRRPPGGSAEGEEILACVRSLPPAYRETLLMRLVEGLSGPEIAAATGLTPDSVRVNLSRGLRQLRARLARRGITR